jgi:hypothetical protein
MKKLENLLAGMIIGGLICMLVFALTSCSTTGYGCKGRSKCMTRVY